jgi:hypothetical protein
MLVIAVIMIYINSGRQMNFSPHLAEDSDMCGVLTSAKPRMVATERSAYGVQQTRNTVTITTI